MEMTVTLTLAEIGEVTVSAEGGSYSPEVMRDLTNRVRELATSGASMMLQVEYVRGVRDGSIVPVGNELAEQAEDVEGDAGSEISL